MKVCETCGRPISNQAAIESLAKLNKELCPACWIRELYDKDEKQPKRRLTTEERMDQVQDQSYKWGEPRQ